MEFSWKRFFVKLSERKFWMALFGVLLAVLGMCGVATSALSDKLGGLADALAVLMGVVLVIVWEVGEAKSDRLRDTPPTQPGPPTDDGKIVGALLIFLLPACLLASGCAGGYSNAERALFGGLVRDGGELVALDVEDARADLAMLDSNAAGYADARRQLQLRVDLAGRVQARLDALSQALRGRVLTVEELTALIHKYKEIQHEFRDKDKGRSATTRPEAVSGSPVEAGGTGGRPGGVGQGSGRNREIREFVPFIRAVNGWPQPAAAWHEPGQVVGG